MAFVPLVFMAVVLIFLYETTENLLAPIVTHALYVPALLVAVAVSAALGVPRTAATIPAVLCSVQNEAMRGFTADEWQTLRELLGRLLATAQGNPPTTISPRPPAAAGMAPPDSPG